MEILKQKQDQSEPLNSDDLERIRERIGKFVQTLPGEKTIDNE